MKIIELIGILKKGIDFVFLQFEEIGIVYIGSVYER